MQPELHEQKAVHDSSRSFNQDDSQEHQPFFKMNFLKTIGGAVSSAFTSSGIETPAFEVGKEAPHEEVERRSYPSTAWVSTQVKAMRHKEAGTEGFWRLFNYIQGKNERSEIIPMTAPVAIKVEPGAGPNCESTFTISFYIGDDHKEDPPLPTNPDVYIDRWGAMSVFVRKFDGFANDEKWIDHAHSLAERLGEEKYVQDYYYTAGYDSPFKLFNRRNEVWFIINREEGPQAERKASLDSSENVDK